MIKRKSGIILGISLIIFLVISIIGAALITVVMSRAKQTNDLEKRTQAYFFAKSGVEIAREYFKNTNLQNKIHVIYGDLSSEDEDGNISLSVLKENYTGDWKDNIREKLEEFRMQQDKEITVAVWKDSGKTRILSTGCAGDFSRVITFELMLAGNSGGGVPVFDMAIFAGETVTIGSAQTIEGNVGTNATDTSAIRSQGSDNKDLKIDGEVFFGPGTDIQGIDPKEYTKDGTVSTLEDPRDYKAMLPEFPDFPDFEPEGSMTVEYDYVIDKDIYYTNLTVKGVKIKGEDYKTTLTIDTGATGTIRNIIVDNLSLQKDGYIELSGHGKLNLFVRELNGSGGYINKGGSPEDIDRVVVYYSGSSLGSLHLNGTLFFGTNNTISLEQGNSALDVNGLIIYGGKKITLKGNQEASAVALFAPSAEIETQGTPSFYGAIVCKSYESGGGGGVYYKNIKDEFSETSLEIINGNGEAYELWGE